jgi:toxin ParE1/3/4
MVYRLVGRAEDQIDRILLASAREWGIEGAARYHRLMLAAMAAVGDNSVLPGSRNIPRVAGLKVFPLRLARRLVDPEHLVRNPRHVIVYRTGPDGVVEILSFVHDRMLLAHAARRAQREAGS